ncbi:hypothetical protein GJ496_007489 [Pomphorhynchus laevis]|nr:hypothetical protein GJ496_007489 [Pomphorhynchus laevis]
MYSTAVIVLVIYLSEIQSKESNLLEDVYKVDFNPKLISLKLNSTKNIQAKLSWIQSPPSSTDFLLLVKKADGLTKLPVKEFNFDNTAITTFDLAFTNVGRFNYFVELVEEPAVKIRGSLIVYVYKQKWAEILCYILGWTYFLLWSFSFYPQIILNHKRKSVVGLSFDFTYINLVGFLPFMIFNILLYFPGSVQEEYFKYNPHSPLPVELNDVVFSTHATILCAITAIQCCIFERGDQQLTYFGKLFILFSALFIIIIGILVAAGKVTLLYFMISFSYIKLASTLIKSIPQIYFNYQRKSTVGWSIAAIIFDALGGLCSFLQQFIIAVNYEKWSVIYGNVVKLLLGIGSILFDIIFIIQHYVLYRNCE